MSNDSALLMCIVVAFIAHSRIVCHLHVFVICVGCHGDYDRACIASSPVHVSVVQMTLLDEASKFIGAIVSHAAVAALCSVRQFVPKERFKIPPVKHNGVKKR